jgi:hypothetical protein
MRKSVAKQPSQPTHAGRRPFLDHLAESHVKIFAEHTGRSLSNAASTLIVAGYQSTVDQMEVKARHYVPPTESDTRKAVAYYLPETLINEVRKLALADNKSASGMVTDLIRAGLQARSAATAAA